MRPRLLDLFCGAGGATMGYQRAGFYVIGVDIKPQPNYCGDEFIQADALEVLACLTDPEPIKHYEDWLPATKLIWPFNAIHASPPCQSYSRRMRHLSAWQPMLIDCVRKRLMDLGIPWVIENVEGAPLPSQCDLFGAHGVRLCGTMFGLRMWRHRLFESSAPIPVPRGCDHARPSMNPHNQVGRDLIYAEFGRQNPDPIWNEAMGVGWMNRYEGREAIPPAYTEHIGHYLMIEIKARKMAR